MFHPRETPLERGWVGRIHGDEIVHLAAQTLQAFFLGGGGAREHARYPLAEAVLLAPVAQPPVVRVFEDRERFAFANANAVAGPGAVVARPAASLSVCARLAAVVGANEQIGGFTLLAEWQALASTPPKDRDFSLVLGPVLVTPDELGDLAPEAIVRCGGREVARGRAPSFDWDAARAHAAAGTRLRAGDVIAGPPALRADEVGDGLVEVEWPGIGSLPQTVA